MTNIASDVFVTTSTEHSPVAGTDESADDDVTSLSSRPHYYDDLDDSSEKPSLPPMASSFIKMQPSSSSTAVYNSVARRLMVGIIISVIFHKIIQNCIYKFLRYLFEI